MGGGAMIDLNDTERLLELAAKASNRRISNRLVAGGLMVCTPGRPAPHKWNPRDDDGDALRLGVQMRMFHDTESLRAFHAYYSDEISRDAKPTAATRLAILRVAASMGALML